MRTQTAQIDKNLLARVIEYVKNGLLNIQYTRIHVEQPGTG